jgi:ribosomal-protein-alanine N-acetyltransferase
LLPLPRHQIKTALSKSLRASRPITRAKGYASEAAFALVDFASRDNRVRTICAHTLPETNASTRVLEKCGFEKVGELVDSENNLVWRWERNPA